MKPRIDPQRWKKIDELLDAAIDLEPEKRVAYLDQECGNDQDLRKEVEGLLALEERSENFIALPVLDPGSEYRDHEIELRERDVIAERYELISTLGSGGMGEVWLAFDLKLRVNVALKTLRFHLDRSADRIEDLHREIRNARDVISPNVCRIFDLVVDNDRDFISMEYVDGMTLSGMLHNIPPIQLSKARDIAAQFLAGLQAVHDAGLVHCDLKPENIMITHTGRVVVMDFGIAKEVAQTRSTISGTPAYMAPEQLCGEAIDARSDIYAAGIILAEMIHPDGIVTERTREEIWNAVRQDPPQLADGPWKSAIARAVATDPNDRFTSAAALARALEEATERIETAEERTPYPGLASFTAADSQYFFGREQEVETVIKKLKQLHLMALVGASGSGKTSFLRAGLIPALPKGWSCIFSVPGDTPQLNLQQALILEFSGDAEATEKMFRFDEPEVALRLLNRWRRKYTEVVLIIDRFEELFTLNGTEVQSHFAELIGTAAVESGIRVLLSMRDDFLLRCHHYAPLAPIFSELSPLESLTGPSLRRALVQPALKCGYRFEDEMLVEEIFADVEKERGALPLTAFAAAQLWKKRDRQSGILSRKAYKQIGGVAGALSRHAEDTMDKLGSERRDIVREIFHNLITAENTRAARDTDELLSIFQKEPGGRSSLPDAQEVLQTLIDARLLTSFEAPSIDEEEKPKRRVEIIHESLLSAWPRLVRWQTQDTASAQLRDQLRQAAQVWEHRNRSEDLLWTGTAFAEFQLWRRPYRGRLTTTEEAFAHAMTQRANKKRRQLRLAATATFVVLLSILAVILNFWQRERVAKDNAVLEAKRAEAGKVLTIGRSLAEADSTTKLAYALASIELADSPHARRFALQALSEGPPGRAVEIETKPARNVEFSPDGRWLAVNVQDGLQLYPRDGAAPIVVSQPLNRDYYLQWSSQFSPDSKFLIWTWRKDPRIVKVWSIAEKKVVRTFQFEGLTMCMVRGGKAFLLTDTRGRLVPPYLFHETIIRTWSFDNTEPEMIGKLDLGSIGWNGFDIDSNGRSIAYAKGKDVCIRSLDVSGIGPEKVAGTQPALTRVVRFRPGGKEIAATDESGAIRFWSLISATKHLVRVLGVTARILWFDREGSILFTRGERVLRAWDLEAPDGTEPHSLRFLEEGVASVSFDSENRWMAITGGSSLSVYPFSGKYPYRFLGKSSNIRFTPDGKALMSGFSKDGYDGVHMWNLPGEKYFPASWVWKSKTWNAEGYDIDSAGKHVIVATPGNGLHLINIPDGKDQILQSKLPDKAYSAVAFSQDCQLAAAAGPVGIEVFELTKGTSIVLEQSKQIRFDSLTFGPDGTLFAGAVGKLYRWNLKTNSVATAEIGKHWVSGLTVSADGRYLATSAWSRSTWDELQKGNAQLSLHDLERGKVSPITSHGNRVFSVAFDPGGTKLITGDFDGIVRVGPVNGEAPHLLLGHESVIGDISVHPHGKWIASRDNRGSVRLWKIPNGKPFDSLPHTEFLKRLRAMTNIRAVSDNNSPTGYRIQYESFPGWSK